MIEVSTSDLHRAVETLHGCAATPLHIEPVRLDFQGERVWEGLVHVFELHKHPKADRAFAWSSPVEGTQRRKFYAVLAVPPVNTAEDAVKASIVADSRSQ